MTTPLDTVQSVDFKILDYGKTHKIENGEIEPIFFFNENDDTGIFFAPVCW